MIKTPNAQYNIAEPDSFVLKVTANMRRKMFSRFMTELAPATSDTILDVGATSDRSYESSNYLEAWYPEKARITAVGIDDASHLERDYPGVKFVLGDGKDLPFVDNAFDFVHSSAVIEHVGSRGEQLRFISELWRVASRGIFVTTPNRWFPIEVHTGIPLLHWLPPSTYRAILRLLEHDFLAKEENLNLFGRSDLIALCVAAQIEHSKIDLVRLLGWPSNLILIASK